MLRNTKKGQSYIFCLWYLIVLAYQLCEVYTDRVARYDVQPTIQLASKCSETKNLEEGGTKPLIGCVSSLLAAGWTLFV